jgi:hypothetical protein
MNTNNEQKFYYATGLIGRSFYDDYIKDDVSKKTQDKFEALLENEDDFIEYYRVSISNPDDRDWEFSSLWFFDINLEAGAYYPLYKAGINTSSSLALVMCGIDRDDDEDEDNTFTLEELMEFAPNGNEKSKQTIKRLLLLQKH